MTDDPQPAQADDDPPEVLAAGATARSKLDLLREFCDLPNSADLSPCVLVRVAGDEAAADLWLRVVAVDAEGGGFAAEVAEVPDGFAGAAPGDVLMVPADDVRDWVVNDDGELFGGYTLRLERAALAPADQAAYDQALGVRKYR